MAVNEVPRRRIRLQLSLGADTVGDVLSALNQIEFYLLEKENAGIETAEITSGGYSDGWHLEMPCNPEQTGDRFREELEVWHNAEREARRGCTG